MIVARATAQQFFVLKQKNVKLLLDADADSLNTVFHCSFHLASPCCQHFFACAIDLFASFTTYVRSEQDKVYDGK